MSKIDTTLATAGRDWQDAEDDAFNPLSPNADESRDRAFLEAQARPANTASTPSPRRQQPTTQQQQPQQTNASASDWLDAEDDSFNPLAHRSAADVAREREFLALQRVHGTLGFRDGVADGKEKSMQQGFDDGYKEGFAAGLAEGLGLGRAAVLKEK
ncbi:hypothetical protein HDU98_008188 [Podochytrium sp. JEL0797]|nr:hypothetical protein HDU98_008188 [Podochytrium sp. JEL0797]